MMVSPSKEQEISKSEKYTFSKDSMNIVDKLHHNATHHPDSVILRMVDANCHVNETLTYSQLWTRSGVVADRLKERGVKAGDRVMIAYPFGLAFLEGFFGCLRAGVIACSVYPPNPKKEQAQISFDQFNEQVRDAGAKFALTTAKFKRLIQLVGRQTKVHWIATDAHWRSKRASSIQVYPYKTASFAPDDVAFIQFSSGSTGTPKGVVISHGAIVHNIGSIASASIRDASSSCLGVSWLPQYHDYGFVNFFLGPVYEPDFPCVVCSPIDFIKNPALWADMLENFNATHTAGPNFAYSLLAKRLTSIGRVFQNSRLLRANIAAEPISPETIAAMKQIGIPTKAIMPCYGMSESCVYVTHCLGDEVTTLDGVVSSGLLDHSEARETRILIRDQATGNTVTDGEVGEILISSPSLASGYWAKPEDTKEHFGIRIDGEEYFATGDLGMIVDRRLYIVGRAKELIIVNGKNIYPTDIERLVEATFPSVRPGSTAAYQHTAAGVGLALEIRNTALSSNADTASRFEGNLPTSTTLRSLIRRLGVDVVSIYALRQGTAPKTTSGKLRRNEVKHRSLEQEWHRKSILWMWRDETDHLTEKQKGPLTSGESLHALMEEMPTDRFPQGAVEAIRALQADKSKLERYFKQLRLHVVPEILEAWDLADKSTTALQSMCEVSAKLLLANYPTAIQFIHLMQDRPDWLLEDCFGQMEEIAHCGYVLEWATKYLGANPHLLKAKYEADLSYEKRLLAEHGKSRAVPKDARFLVGGRETDPLIGLVDTFGWLKHRSIQHLMSKLVRAAIAGAATSYEIGGGVKSDWITLNVLEATWLDHKLGRYDNATVGSWLVTESRHDGLMPMDGTVTVKFAQEAWKRVYMMWNLAIMTSLRNPEWVMSKLLIPSVAEISSQWVMHRVISLHLTAQLDMDRKVNGSPSPRIFSGRATKAFGVLNRKWLVGQHFFDDATHWDPVSSSSHDLTSKTLAGEWFSRFDAWNQTRHLPSRNAAKCATSQVDFDALVSQTLGESFDPHETWDALGLSSLASVTLKNAIADKLAVSLPPNCFEVYPTPNALKEYTASMKDKSFPTRLYSLNPIETQQLSWFLMGALQFLGVAALLLMFSSAIIPAYHVGKIFASNSMDQTLSVMGQQYQWLWLPIAIPTFMLAFSLLLILAKWVVIGRYQQGELLAPSLAFVSWWWIDRGIHMWEVWVGRFVTDTPLIWLFYRLMGAKIHRSVKLKSFIREFDLVNVGPGASIQHPIKCRTFKCWAEDGHPMVTFRPIKVSNDGIVKGMLCPGSTVGEGAIVERLSVVPEGAQVPERVVARGNPACLVATRQLSTSGSVCSWKLGALKILWLFVEIYIFFGLILIGRFLLRGRLPLEWRYTPLTYWVSLISVQAILSILVSISLKWILIGKRLPGTRRNGASLRGTFLDWAADYHFQITSTALLSLTSNSKIWNLILQLHGMNIDFTSRVVPDAFPPSKLDLISVRSSFIARVTMDVEKDSRWRATEITDGSIGYKACIGPSVQIINQIVPPVTNITECSNDGASKSQQQDHNSAESWMTFCRKTAAREFFYVCFLIIFVMSLIPTYEIWQTFLKPASATMATPVLALSLIIQTNVWLVFFALFQQLILPRRKIKAAIEWMELYAVFVTAATAIQVWSCLSLLWGTPMMNLILRGMGAKIGGRVLYFGNRFHDAPYITMADRTIVDGAMITGHSTVYEAAFLAPVEVSGIIRDGTWVADTIISNKVSGPWRACIGSNIDDTHYSQSKLDNTKHSSCPSSLHLHDGASSSFALYLDNLV